jgi:hypothetical protein
MSKHYDPPIPFARINALIETLQSNAPLSDAERAEIADALDCLYITLLIERDQRTLGRRTNPHGLAVAVMHGLIVKYGAQQKAAAGAVARPGNAKAIETLCRAYRTARARGYFRPPFSVADDVVARAAKHLPKSGNK